ncbi:MAG: protein kinase [Planctomycetaceae bacterium]|nr:protein kinase [Planctomycetales bacterium]MCB9941964.1 protein kinase [Planctomycetaceae bacterium]
MDTDRNLLFGILALQLGHVDSTQFTEACAAWAVAKQKTLAEILVERGWITRNDSAEVEQLVARKIEKHAGDAHKSLVMEATGDMPAVPSVSGQLEATIDSSARSPDSGDLHDTHASTPSASTPTGYSQMETLQYEATKERSRYSLTKMHGEGGIGRVWQAHDQRLNRQVALKEIRPDREASANATKRFAKEAQITSQLEHPNIVPVYELCGGPDSSRSFYTMRFVRGDTFRDAIDAYHRHRREGRATELELRELLSAFIAICNALGYAHSRGVLHRDLKPSNVMVGSFGEVVVLDWGLAKMIDQPDDDDEHLLESGPISVTDDVGIDVTMQGAVLGTLPYMAPEQAAGRIDKIDTRTDIYGLGAILFAILTGDHPHRGTSTREVRSQIVNEPTPRVRTENSTVHPSLDAICAKAMAKKRSERYAKARDLAEDIRRWLADEPIECYAEPMSMRVGRWLRRHRTWAQAIAATLLIVTFVSVVSVLVVNRAREAEKTAKDRASASLQAETRARAEATRRFEEARDAVDTMMTGVSEVLAYFPGMQALREQLLTQAVQRYQQFTADEQDDPELQAETARAMIRLGDVFRGLSKYDLAKETYTDAAQRMQTQLDGNAKTKDARVQLASAKSKLGALFADLGEYDESVQCYGESLRLLDEQLSLQADPQLEYERAGVAVNLAMLSSKRGMSDEALTQLEAASQVFGRLAGDGENPAFAAGLAMTKANIANVLISMGRNAAAIEHAQEAMQRYATLADQAPNYPPYLESLATTRLNLAAAYRTSGRDREELAMYEAALGDYDLLVSSRSDVPLYRERRASTERELAMYLHAVGDNHTAQTAIMSAIETTEALLNTQIPLAGYHEQWAIEQATLGRILSDLGHEEEAALHLGAATERLEALIENDPDFSTSYKSQRAACWTALGTLYQKMGDDEAALAMLKQAEAAFKDLATASPENAAYSNGLAWTYSYLADLMWQSEDSEAAVDYYNKALQLRLKLTDEPEHQNNLARLIVSCRNLDLATGDRAIKAARAAVAIAPENARYVSTLGSAYAKFGQYDQAIETLRSVDKLGPRGGTTHEFWLAFALAKRNQEGDRNEARNRFRQAITRMEFHAPGRNELSQLRTLIEPMLAEPAAPGPDGSPVGT